jgi:hypothetical protein
LPGKKAENVPGMLYRPLSSVCRRRQRPIEDFDEGCGEMG